VCSKNYEKWLAVDKVIAKISGLLFWLNLYILHDTMSVEWWYGHIRLAAGLARLAYVRKRNIKQTTLYKAYFSEF